MKIFTIKTQNGRESLWFKSILVVLLGNVFWRLENLFGGSCPIFAIADSFFEKD